MALRVHGFVDGAYHVLVGARGVGYVFEHFGNGLAGDGQAVAVQEAGFEQHFHDLRNAAGLVQIDREVFAAGLEVAQHRGFDADALEVVNRPLDAGRVGNRQEMQESIGRAAGGHDHGHSVFNGLFRDDVARLDVLFDGLDQHLGRFLGRVGFLVVRVGHGG